MYESPGLWALVLSGFVIPLWIILSVAVLGSVGLFFARKHARRRRNGVDNDA